MSMLLQLPDDILFNIIELLKPSDLFHIRKTCKQLQAFVATRPVWTNAYRTSNYFLPPGPSSDQSVRNLEHILVHAQRLEAAWTKPMLLSNADSWNICEPKLPNIYFLEIYRKYLIIGLEKALILYDLQTKSVVFSYTEPSSKLFWLSHRNNTPVHEDADLFVPFGVMKKSALVICRIKSSGAANIIEIKDVQMSLITVCHEFCTLRQNEGTDSLQVLHIPSEKTYPIRSSQLNLKVTNANVIFLPNYVLLVYSMYHRENGFENDFEFFPLPDPIAVATGVPLYPSHSGTLQMGFTELTFVSCDELNHRARSIWFVGLFHDQGAQPLRVTLRDDGTISFHPPNTQPCASPLHSPYHLLLSTTGSRARAISRTAVDPSAFIIYDIGFDLDRNLFVNAKVLDKTFPCIVYAFDAFRGLLCFEKDSNEVYVLDFTGVLEDAE